MRTTPAILAVLLPLSCSTLSANDTASTADPDWFAAAYLTLAVPSGSDVLWGPAVEVGRQVGERSSVSLDVSHPYYSTDLIDEDDLELTPVLIKYRYSVPFGEGWVGSAGLVAGVVFERLESTRSLLDPEDDRRDSASAVAGGAEVALAYQTTNRLQLEASASLLAVANTSVLDGVLPQFRFGSRWSF